MTELLEEEPHILRRIPELEGAVRLADPDRDQDVIPDLAVIDDQLLPARRQHLDQEQRQIAQQRVLLFRAEL